MNESIREAPSTHRLLVPFSLLGRSAILLSLALFAGCSGESFGAVCGNGHLDLQELCDDGNTADGDGCSADCQSDESCGNWIVDDAAGEACDDGNLLSGDGCQETCALPTCGDGFVDPGEVCEPGSTDGCNASCAGYMATCADLLAADATAPSGLYFLSADGSGTPESAREYYCDMATGRAFHASVHNWGAWGSGMTIVIADRGAAEVGSIAEWDAACALFATTKYAGSWAEAGVSYSDPAYMVYADAADYWTTTATQAFPGITYDSVLVLQDALSPGCWAWYAEVGSMQAFGSPAGTGYAFCRGGDTATLQYHIYLCL